MDRADGLGTGVAVVGHVALFGALSMGLAASIPPKPVPPPAMEVEFVDTVALESSAPAAEPMPQAEAPELGPPEEAAPAPVPVPEPLPAPPPVELAPPPPAPEPVVVRAPPPKPVAKPKPVVAKPAPVKKAVTKPAPDRAAVAKANQAKAADAKAAQAKANQLKAAQAKAAQVKATQAKAAQAKTAQAKAGKGEKTANRGERLGKDFLAGLKDPSPGKAATPAAPAITADAMAGIQAAIKRQIQPCANRQVNPGPGANRILVKLNLKLNQDGSLASAPRVVSTSGIDDENSRYEKRVADLAIAAYKGCAPMKGLPVDLYRTAKGGWNNVNMNYKLPG